MPGRAPVDVPAVRPPRRLLPFIAAAVLPVALLAQAPAMGAAAGPAGGRWSPRPGQAATASRCSTRSDLLARAPVATWRPGHGVVVRGWNGTDGRGHDVRLTVAQADVGRVRLAAAAVARYGDATPTTRLTGTVRAAVAGINGDYFSYDWSGAAVPDGPLVVGGRVLRLPPGENRAVGTDTAGRPFAALVRIVGNVRLPVRGRAPARSLPVASLNDDGDVDGADAVAAGQAVAVVTPYLGAGRPRHAREVVLRRGSVLAVGRRLSFGPGSRFGSGPAGRGDVLLAADGAAARSLGALTRGNRVRIAYAARAADGTRPRQAVGSGAVMLRRGEVVAACSRSALQSRPRTLVAWNSGRSRVWLLTVDGRGSTPVSRFGATYRQVAELARSLGASDAVMVDGGGSTTMAVRSSGGAVSRVDAPQTAPQRPVPDGLVLIPR